MKSCIFSISKKDFLGITKNHRDKLYLQRFIMPNYSIVSDPKTEKILRKIRTTFEGSIHNFTASSNPSDHWRSAGKNFEATQLFVDFSKAFDSIHRGKVEATLLVCDLPKEIVTAMMELYKSTKAMVHSPDRDTDSFSIVLVSYKVI